MRPAEFALILPLILALAAQTPDGPPISKAAAHFVQDFRGTCLAGYGRLEVMRRTSEKAGYSDTGVLEDLPESFLAKKGRLTLVYRGRMDGDLADSAPQCLLQAEDIPGGSFDGLAAAVDRLVGAARVETPSRPRPTVKWRLLWPKGHLLVFLTDDVLLGSRNLRLSVMPDAEDQAGKGGEGAR